MTKKYIIILLLLISCSLIVANSITVPQINQTFYIGQIINIELDLTKQKPDRVFLMNETSTSQLEYFEIVEIRDKPWNYLLRIAPFDTGYIETERIPLYFSTNNLPDTIFVEPFSFYVKTSLTVADTLLKDIAHPVSYNLKFLDYLIPILILLIICAIIYYQNRNKKPKNVEKIYVDNRSAWEIALELLKALRQRKLVESGQYLEYYFELSLIFRIFLERQFNVKAVEMTTIEIKHALQEVADKRQIIQMLSDMDKIKFAKFVPKLSEANDVTDWIEKYIKSFEHKSTIPVNSSSTTTQETN